MVYPCRRPSEGVALRTRAGVPGSGGRPWGFRHASCVELLDTPRFPGGWKTAKRSADFPPEGLLSLLRERVGPEG